MSSPTTTQPIRAAFNPLIRPYMVLNVALVLALTVVGLPLAVVWLCGLGQWWARHYFEKLECELSSQVLRFRKGILFQVEKTIPLENIQDVTFIEGPLLKHFNLSILKFETAGQSVGQAHDMRLVGIVDAHAFRAQILQRRQALKAQSVAQPVAPSAEAGETLLVLRAILQKLNELDETLKRRIP